MQMAFDVLSFPHVLLERTFRSDALRRAPSNDRSRIFRERKSMELKPRFAELCREPFRVGLSHAADRIQTEMAQACLGLWPDTPKTRHGLRRQPRSRILRRHYRQAIRLLVGAGDLGN